MALIRRMWPILLLALAPLWPLRRAVFMAEAIGPFDQIRQMAPWGGPKPAQPWDVLQADGVLQFYVWRDLVFESWRSGRIPQWNPYELCGTPLLANSQSAPLYPLHIMLGALHVPTVPAMTILAWFHVFWAGLGVYCLSRRLGAQELGGFVAGLGFSLSSFMVLWTGLPSVITTVAWIPWVLLGVMVCFDQKGSGTQSGRGSPALLSLSVAMLLLAGHLQFAAYGMIAAGVAAVGLVLVQRPYDLRALAWIIVGLALGLGLALPQLLPVVAYSRYSHRQNSPSEAGYRAYVAGAIKPFELANLSTFRALGDPRRYNAAAPVPDYWVPLSKQGANLAESAVTIGPLALLLAIMAPFVKVARRAWYSVGIAGLLALALAMGTPINRLLYFLVPGWSATGSPGRSIVLFVLAAAVLAGLTIDRLREGGLTARTSWLSIAAAAAVALGFWRMGVAAVPAVTDDAALMARFNASWIVPGALSMVAGLVVASLVCWRQARDRIWVVASIVVGSWAVSSAGLSPMTSSGTLDRIRPDDPSKRIAIVNEDWGLGAAAKALMPPNTAAGSRIREVGGYDSLVHRDTVAMLREIVGGDPAPPANGNIMFVKPSADPRALAEAGATAVWSLRRLPQFDQTCGEPRQREGFLEYALPGPGRASIKGGFARIVVDEPGRIIVAASGPGELVVRERAMRGWTATIGGRSRPVPEGRWMTVPNLGADEVEVELRYQAPGLPAGFAAAAVCLTTLGAISVLRRVRTLG